MTDTPKYRVLSTRTIVLGAVTLLLLAIGMTAWLLLSYGTAEDGNRLEAIKTAGTIVLGAGGAAALWLAARRQRSTELALAQTEHDATERRITELYTKAADQLGSDKAAVRLAGLYALERLAQNTPSQRQTIVNVLCAYLRMRSTEFSEQEQEVRRTAQRILTTHLRPGAVTFWSDIDLDLTNTALDNVDFTGLHVRSAQFRGARFSGVALFTDARFGGVAGFEKVEFDNHAVFIGVTFEGNVAFHEARFHGDVDFSLARFGAHADFAGAEFTRVAMFVCTEFSGPVSFIGSRFNGPAHFGRAQFAGTSRFSQIRFGRDVSFERAKFIGQAVIEQVLFAGHVDSRDVEFAEPVQLKDVLVRVDTGDEPQTSFPGT